MSKITTRVTKRAVTSKKGNNETEASAEVLPSAASSTYDATFWSGRHLVLSNYNGRVLIHVREYMSIDGREYPTKKGACFTPLRLVKLRAMTSDIDEALNRQRVNVSYIPPVMVGAPLYKEHIGGGTYVSVSEQYNGVDFRRYWKPEDAQEPVPTKSGIYLPVAQWKALKSQLNELYAAHSELLIAEDCFHQNQMGQVGCCECDPFGYKLFD